MTRKQHWAAVLVLGAMAFATLPWVRSQNPSPLDQLRKKYRWESIYVMKLALQSATYLLNDRAKYRIHSARPGAEPGLTLLKKFLNDHQNDRQYEEVAFLQINLSLSDIKSGYKLESDYDGVIHETNWVRNEVEGIAIFCDGYLNGSLSYANAQKIVAGNNPIQGWRELEKLRTSPFIPNEALVPLYDDFHRSVKANAKELDKLKGIDGKTFEAIKSFEKDFDKKLGTIPNNADEVKGILKRVSGLDGDFKKLSAWQSQRWQKVLETIPGVDNDGRKIEFRPPQKPTQGTLKPPVVILPRLEGPDALIRIHRDAERIPELSKPAPKIKVETKAGKSGKP